MKATTLVRNYRDDGFQSFVRLLAGLSYLKVKGFRIAQITVDSENTVACALYHSIGFTLRETSLWYQERLD
jgi:predicted GNAT family acetyltransferase